MTNPIVDNNTLILTIDSSIYDEKVISKVLYWYAADFIICRNTKEPETSEIVKLRPKKDNIAVNWQNVISDISDKFIDYRNRQIILEETNCLRELLFAKAFANNDDFVEFDFKD